MSFENRKGSTVLITIKGQNIRSRRSNLFFWFTRSTAPKKYHNKNIVFPEISYLSLPPILVNMGQLKNIFMLCPGSLLAIPTIFIVNLSFHFSFRNNKILCTDWRWAKDKIERSYFIIVLVSELHVFITSF